MNAGELSEGVRELTANPSATKVPAHITISAEQTNDWKVKCDSCKQTRLRPIRVLVIGGLGLELCGDCVEELKAVLVE